MKYFMSFQTEKYEDWCDIEFTELANLIKFVNERTTNPDFKFRVIRGELIEFESIEMVKAYRVKK